jgi:hypothetical protein
VDFMSENVRAILDEAGHTGVKVRGGRGPAGGVPGGDITVSADQAGVDANAPAGPWPRPETVAAGCVR